MQAIYETVVCPWTAENPRHDHQLILPLQDGRLMLVWSEYYVQRPSLIFRTRFDQEGGAGDQAPCRLSGRISTDNGRTWSERIILQENLWGSNVKHPNLLRLPSGETLFFFTAWESETERNVFMKRSVDECESWGEITQISAPGWYCTNNDHILQLRSGRIILPSHGGPGYRLARENPLHSFVFYSDDGFRTWKMSADTMTAPGRGAHEPSIVELRDGRLLCMLRTTQGRVYRAYSKDQGDHWSVPEPTTLKAPDSPPLVKRIPTTGDLLLLWNHVESHSNWPRTPLTAAISRDEGETWENIKDVEARPDWDAAYAAVTFVGDEALVTYYTRSTSWARDSEVTLKILPIDWFYTPA